MAVKGRVIRFGSGGSGSGSPGGGRRVRWAQWVPFGALLIFGLTGGLAGTHSWISEASAESAVADVADSFSFDSLHTDYQLTKDAGGHANLAVTETFQARFPDTDQNHGIERAIPRSGDGRSLHVKVYDVTDGDKKPVQFEETTQGQFTVLRIGNPWEYVHGVQTYVIDYSMRDVIQQPLFSSKQRFNFDVNGTGWAQPFGTVDATLHVPADLASSLSGDNQCFQGKAGSTATCDLTRSYAGFQASASDLAAHENLTMSIGFKPGTFVVPVSWQRVLVWVLLGLAVLLLGYGIVVRRLHLGDARGRGIIVPQYQAFPGIGVMEAAELLDERNRAFPALVTELVVSRAATMTRDDRGTEKTKDDLYSLRLLDATVLDDEDSAAVATLFGSIKPGKQVTLNPDKPKIGDRIVKLLAAARDNVRKTQGLIARKSTVASGILLAAGIVLALASVFWIVYLNATALGSWVHYIALGVAAALSIALVVVVWPRERRTAKAMPAYEHLLGIRDYLRLAEADRIRMLQSPSGAETRPVIAADVASDGASTTAAPDNTVVVRLYEKLLPYAILFGIEKEWREVLGGYWATTPTDVTPTLLPLQTFAFTSAFASSNFATTASTTSSSGSSSWSSSGGSSSFGGGSSGGGFGGGGGGGW